MKSKSARWNSVVCGATAAASVIGVAVAAAAIANSSGDESVADVAVPKRSAQVQSLANQTFAEFDGTIRQRNASGALQAWALNGGMDACMEQRGFPEWDWSGVRNRAPRTDALAWSTFFKDPAGKAISNAMVDVVEDRRAEFEARTIDPPVEQNDAIDACVETVSPTPEDEIDPTVSPKAAQQLRGKWWDLLESLDARYGETTPYSECFAKAATPALGSTTRPTADSWTQALMQKVPPPDFTPDSTRGLESPDPRWAAFLALEAAWEQVDWQCRASTYRDHLDDVEAAIIGFAEDHADEIKDAQRQWVEIEANAAKIGFRGQSGSLDPQAARS